MFCCVDRVLSGPGVFGRDPESKTFILFLDLNSSVVSGLPAGVCRSLPLNLSLKGVLHIIVTKKSICTMGLMQQKCQQT